MNADLTGDYKGREGVEKCVETVASFEGNATSKLIIHSTQLPFHLFSDLLKFFKALYFPADLHTITQSSTQKTRSKHPWLYDSQLSESSGTSCPNKLEA